ncbi:Error-prone repair protein ImuA [Dyadobacter sp. LHD-138]|uniref:ImuA family protein n=1 Tax=Dyadobacter sp. LHD-138 TaxID=3071413 RepID=UPI0027E0E645|nr:Error-prone repair protein ImuA [Dyadobacter sp. LHD-138]MDQ6482144.1 Error-prone repair protein ImuA [Dyadobacter sp. LHD-138]
MEQVAAKSEVIEKLRKDILSLQGFRVPTDSQKVHFGLGPIEAAFPNGVFPTGAVHEFLSDNTENAAATTGFMAGLLSRTMQRGGFCVWLSSKRTVFPAALKFFGVEPERVIFIDVRNEKDLLWMVEEALKCQALAAVVGELQEVNLTESRRLQLAVEQSRVTGLLHRHNPRNANTIAAVSRWKISSLPSNPGEDLPGMGFYRWHVELLKVRNGEPGSWQVQWISGHFEHILKPEIVVPEINLLQTA